MGFFKSLFGGKAETPEEEKRHEAEKNFDVFKYDGVRALRTNQVEYAVKCFQKALELHDDLEVRDYLSQALMRANELQLAKEQLMKLHEAQSDNVAVLIRMADVDYMTEDYDAMAADCEKALSLDADNTHVLFSYARARIGQQKDAEAIALLGRCISICEKGMEAGDATGQAPYNNIGDARLLRGQTLLRMGDLDAASADAEWLLAHTHDSEDVALFAARVEEAKGNHDRAIGFYTEVIRLNPFCVEAFRERGAVRKSQGDSQGAEEDAKSVLELSPGEADGQQQVGKTEDIQAIMRHANSSIDPFGLGNIKGAGE